MSNGCPYVEEGGPAPEGNGRRERIAVSGKGGTGKTTIAGTLARLLGRGRGPILAIDGDTNPNLAHILGLASDAAERVRGLPRDVLERIEDEGGRRLVLTADPEALIEEYGADAPDRVRLVVMGKVGHAGAG